LTIVALEPLGTSMFIDHQGPQQRLGRGNPSGESNVRTSLAPLAHEGVPVGAYVPPQVVREASGVTEAVAVDEAVADPAELLAVTETRILRPTSAAART
jgi:hypothetical protein